MAIIGVDISHWQGEFTAETAEKLKGQGVRFVYVKFSQGVSVADHCAVANTALLQAGGVKVGAYHYVTKDNAISQAAWFIRCMGDIPFDLPPAMDVEEFGVSQAIVDSMGMRLTEWMADKPKLAAFKYPAIYTNYSTGNRVFTAASMSRYLLWIANWGVTLPNLPKIWQGKPYFVWQDYVIKEAQDWGIDGALDHDTWGDAVPFPGGEPEPPEPPAPTDYIDVRVIYPDGRKYSGRLEKSDA